MGERNFTAIICGFAEQIALLPFEQNDLQPSALERPCKAKTRALRRQ